MKNLKIVDEEESNDYLNFTYEEFIKEKDKFITNLKIKQIQKNIQNKISNTKSESEYNFGMIYFDSSDSSEVEEYKADFNESEDEEYHENEERKLKNPKKKENPNNLEFVDDEAEISGSEYSISENEDEKSNEGIIEDIIDEDSVEEDVYYNYDVQKQNHEKLKEIERKILKKYSKRREKRKEKESNDEIILSTDEENFEDLSENEMLNSSIAEVEEEFVEL